MAFGENEPVCSHLAGHTGPEALRSIGAAEGCLPSAQARRPCRLAAREPQKSGDWFGGACAEAVRERSLMWPGCFGAPTVEIRTSDFVWVACCGLTGPDEHLESRTEGLDRAGTCGQLAIQFACRKPTISPLGVTSQTESGHMESGIPTQWRG